MSVKTTKGFAKDPVHQPLRQMARVALDTTGEFSYKGALKECNMESWSEYIRWDFLRTELEAANYNLIPVSKAFFTRDRWKSMTDEAGSKVMLIDVAPLKFLPTGRTKIIAGLLLASKAPYALREAYVNNRIAMATGAWSCAVAKEATMAEQGLLESRQPNLLPDGEDDDGETV